MAMMATPESDSSDFKPVAYFDIDHIIMGGWRGDLTLPPVVNNQVVEGEPPLLLLEVNLIQTKVVVHVREAGRTEAATEFVVMEPGILDNEGGMRGNNNVDVEIKQLSLTNGEEVRILVNKNTPELKPLSFNIFMYGSKSTQAHKLCHMLRTLVEKYKEKKNGLQAATSLMPGSIPNKPDLVGGSVLQQCKHFVIKEAHLFRNNSHSIILKRPQAQGLSLRFWYDQTIIGPSKILLEWSTPNHNVEARRIFQNGWQMTVNQPHGTGPNSWFTVDVWDTNGNPMRAAFQPAHLQNCRNAFFGY